VVGKLLVVVAEAWWGCAGWRGCSAQLAGAALQRERSSAGQEETEGVEWFLCQNLLQAALLFSLLSPKFEKSVVWREKRHLEGRLWLGGEQMWGWTLPPGL